MISTSGHLAADRDHRDAAQARSWAAHADVALLRPLLAPEYAAARAALADTPHSALGDTR